MINENFKHEIARQTQTSLALAQRNITLKQVVMIYQNMASSSHPSSAQEAPSSNENA